MQEHAHGAMLLTRSRESASINDERE